MLFQFMTKNVDLNISIYFLQLFHLWDSEKINKINKQDLRLNNFRDKEDAILDKAFIMYMVKNINILDIK